MNQENNQMYACVGFLMISALFSGAVVQFLPISLAGQILTACFINIAVLFLGSMIAEKLFKG